MKNKIGLERAFTLAETLITLTIIGVIAVISCMVMIANVRKEATVVQVKSAYSILSNAINKSVLDNGYVEDWDTNEKIFIEKYLAPYLTHVKKLAVNQRYNIFSYFSR